MADQTRICQSYRRRAVEELVKAATNLQDGLYSANREVYRLLKYGAQVKANADENETTVYFIDWETPAKTSLTSWKKSLWSLITKSVPTWSFI